MKPLTREQQALAARWHRYAVAMGRRWASRSPHLRTQYMDEVESLSRSAVCEAAGHWTPGVGEFRYYLRYWVRFRLLEFDRRCARPVPLPQRRKWRPPSYACLDAPLSNEPDQTLHDMLPAPDARLDDVLTAQVLLARAYADLVWRRVGRDDSPERVALAERDVSFFFRATFGDTVQRELAEEVGLTRAAVGLAVSNVEADFKRWAAKAMEEA